MTDINTDGMAIAPGVVDTIVALAVKEVPGVASVGTSSVSGWRSLFSSKQSVSGVSVAPAEDGGIEVSLSLHVFNGYSLNEIANQVRSAIADAVLSQLGLNVSRVDLRVDGILFQD